MVISNLLNIFNKLYGTKEYSSEWDGNLYGGGKGSQRFWEYLFCINNLKDASSVLDVGCGKNAFLRFIDSEVKYHGIDKDVDTSLLTSRTTLEEFVEPEIVIHGFDTVVSISVLEHIKDKETFCKALDTFYKSKIILTFELCNSLNKKSDMLTNKEFYSCMNVFKNHYITEISKCPIPADNSNFGEWYPIGVILTPTKEV